MTRALHAWIWRDPRRRARKLLRFAETEADGGRELVRASELSRDAELRRLLLRHATDEQRHAQIFRSRARAILAAEPAAAVQGGGGILAGDWLAPGERAGDGALATDQPQSALLAFLHLSEAAAARRFALYCQALDGDAQTRAAFAAVLHDEEHHMRYTRNQLVRIAPRLEGRALWTARLGRLWRAYLRLATALASLIGSVLLFAQYVVVLPLFAFLAQRAARREPAGFRPAREPTTPGSQY